MSAVIESNVYYSDGKKIITSASSFLMNDSIAMMPVSTLSEVMGLSVNWSTVDTTVTGFVR